MIPKAVSQTVANAIIRFSTVFKFHINIASETEYLDTLGLPLVNVA